MISLLKESLQIGGHGFHSLEEGPYQVYSNRAYSSEVIACINWGMGHVKLTLAEPPVWGSWIAAPCRCSRCRAPYTYGSGCDGDPECCSPTPAAHSTH